jgi:hypothetical protein
MAPEETQSAGLSRLHLMEAMFHLDYAIEHLVNLCNDEVCDDIRTDTRSAQNQLEIIHTHLCEETDDVFNFDNWHGLEALLERNREAIGHWSAYQFSEWKQSGKVPTNG